MKKLLFLILCFFMIVEGTKAQNFPAKPEPAIFVNDYVGVLENNDKNYLEKTLREYDKTTSTQIAIVIVRSLEGVTIAEYANELFRKWGIGQKNKDNGILILIVTEDRAVRIELGYGVEAYITDTDAANIVKTQMIPHLKERKYGEALQKATETLIKQLQSADFRANTEPTKAWYNSYRVIIIFAVLIVAVIFLLTFLFRKKKRNKLRSASSSSSSYSSSSSSTYYYDNSSSSSTYYDSSSSSGYDSGSSSSSSGYDSGSSSSGSSDSSYGGGDSGGGGYSSDY
ncbi:MAG: hypothetical protein EAZ55_08450 [Cytophagales bacterium]|nr:MAG: hypothetical protein EAZ55_08450 [Cytophagales bacterium]